MKSKVVNEREKIDRILTVKAILKVPVKAIENKKAIGPDGVLVEVWKMLGNVSIIW